DRRRLAGARPADPGGDRDSDRPRIRRPGAPPPAPAPVGEDASPDVRGAPRLLPAARRAGARAVTVHLGGTVPAAPVLSTVRGLELVMHCDVLVYDRLVAAELVHEAPADALRIDRERLGQGEINRLLVAYARAELDEQPVDLALPE